MTITVLQLPPHILAYIFSLIDKCAAPWYSQVSMTCKHFSQILATESVAYTYLKVKLRKKTIPDHVLELLSRVKVLPHLCSIKVLTKCPNLKYLKIRAFGERVVDFTNIFDNKTKLHEFKFNKEITAEQFKHFKKILPQLTKVKISFHPDIDFCEVSSLCCNVVDSSMISQDTFGTEDEEEFLN